MITPYIANRQGDITVQISDIHYLNQMTKPLDVLQHDVYKTNMKHSYPKRLT